MNPIQVKSNLNTGVIPNQINEFGKKLGSSYQFVAVENYPDKEGMRARIIFKHVDAVKYQHENIEIGECYAFSKKQANTVFEKRFMKL
jgi:hypothetical protein